MSEDSRKSIIEYLAKGGKIVADLAIKVYGDSINQVGEDAFSDAIEIGIANTVAALYDADISDDKIINLVNKYWNISMDEAEDRLLHEKKLAATRELKRYMKLQGRSEKDIRQFMISSRAGVKINKNSDLWKLRRNPEKLLKAVQE